MFFYRLLALILLVSIPSVLSAEIPSSWQSEWNRPSSPNRPLLIVHGFFGMSQNEIPHPYLPFAHFENHDLKNGMRLLSEQYGLGGVVVNVSSFEYLRNEEEWKHLIEAVREARDAGLRIWIYDEDRFPSLAAGGLVLEGRPELECRELTYAPDKAEPFGVRPCFEFSHAANNMAYKRRCPNLLDKRTAERFLELTHDSYKKRLGPELFGSVEAFFSDQMSTNVINTGSLSFFIDRYARTVDEQDPEKENLASVVWDDSFPELYEKKYGEDILRNRKSLFEGNSPEDRRTRRQFWSMVADQSIESSYKKIDDWCLRHGTAFAGHGLLEEMLIAHVPLDGNKLRVLAAMQIPGGDCLSSKANGIFQGGWKAVVFPASAAFLSNRRRVALEASDIETYLRRRARATLSEMQGAAAWQTLLGVTDFALYYQTTRRKPEVFKAYCDFVGRLNSILGKAVPEQNVVLYYPIRELQEEYIPQASRIHLDTQSQRTRDISSSFDLMGDYLVSHQIPFCTADADFLRNAEFVTVNGRSRFRLGNQCPDCVVFPQGVEPDKTLKGKLDAFERGGGKLFFAAEFPEQEERNRLDDFMKTYDSAQRLNPPSNTIPLGRFHREGRTILMLLNAGKERYEGVLHIQDGKAGDHWQRLEPATAVIEPLVLDEERHLVLTLEPGESVLFIGP